MNSPSMIARDRHGHRRTTTVVLLALLALLAGLSVVVAPAAAATSAAEARADRYERALVGRLNRARSARGLRSVRVVPCVDAVAERHAARMRRTRRPVPVGDRVMLRECRRVLELDAAGIGGYRPAALVRHWLADRTARSVLLDRRTRWVGAGAVFTRARGWHVSLLVAGRRTRSAVPGEEAAPPTADGTTTSGMSELETAILEETNRRRALRGLTLLQPSACAAEFAGEHSASMADTGVLAHADLEVLRERCGTVAAAENIATGSAGVRLDASSLVQAWMDSPAHRANILAPGLTHLGVGVAEDASGRWYATQDFLEAA
jgi:uncharacterized protein YkwD